MRRSQAALTLLFVTGALAAENSVVIANVTIVDVAAGVRLSAVTVLTKADRIAKIGKKISPPTGAVLVDGTGKFLIPALWDMHAHHQVTGKDSVDLYVARGVAGTRDMGADLDFILPLRDRINRGELLGPEIVASGPMLDAAPPDWVFRRRVTSAGEAREAVRDLKARGVDFIKVHDHTPRQVFFAIAGEAPKVGLPFAGHVPIDITVEEAADSGMQSIEHLANFRVFTDCSAAETYNAVRCKPLFDKLAAKGVWQTPTIAFWRALPDTFSGKPTPHAEYASDAQLEFERRNQKASKLNERQLSTIRGLSRNSMAAIHDLHSRGSRLLAGSDGLAPGFSLHDELQYMAEAGLSPAQALQTATINPAIFLGREKTQGTIEVGKRADLVLLEADPLIDIGAVRRIAAVLVRGRLLTKSDIDRIVSAHRRAIP
jgi:imidazolonepropionase-like amidohydrolase